MLHCVPTSSGGENDGKDDAIQKAPLPDLRQVVHAQPAVGRPAEDLRCRCVQAAVARRKMRRVEQAEQCLLQGDLSQKPP